MDPNSASISGILIGNPDLDGGSGGILHDRAPVQPALGGWPAVQDRLLRHRAHRRDQHRERPGSRGARAWTCRRSTTISAALQTREDRASAVSSTSCSSHSTSRSSRPRATTSRCVTSSTRRDFAGSELRPVHLPPARQQARGPDLHQPPGSRARRGPGPGSDRWRRTRRRNGRPSSTSGGSAARSSSATSSRGSTRRTRYSPETLAGEPDITESALPGVLGARSP